ncbi:ABC transporter permease [bacterium]|nr:ABC transporter permease [bacterium]MBP9806943.1 ABC transporter permease [bacterium]
MAISKLAGLVPPIELFFWVAPFGRAIRLFFGAFQIASLRQFSYKKFKVACLWMGPESFHLVALAAVTVAIALTIQCVVELQKYQAEELSGAVISIGLLREIGPLTVSLAWCARVAARIAAEAQTYCDGGKNEEFAQQFVLPNYLATLAMSIPLGTYGLIIGFITGALVAPMLGVSSTSEFLHSARDGIQIRDIIVYFVKLILVNPTVGFFAGCAAGATTNHSNNAAPSNAVTATFIAGFFANLAVTYAAYLAR